MVRARSDGVEVAVLAPDLFSYLSALAAGATLGEAMTARRARWPRLTQVLGYLFTEETGLRRFRLQSRAPLVVSRHRDA